MKLQKSFNKVLNMLEDGNFQVTKIQEQVMGKSLSDTNMEEVLGRNLI